MTDSSQSRRPFGHFVQERHCRCGFIVDEYDDGWCIEYADPDTGQHVCECPDCGRGLDLLGQKALSS